MNAITVQLTAEQALTVIDALSNFDEVPANSDTIEQIQAQMKPPRIPEPGLWGVVEAHTEGNPSRARYGRTRADYWVREGFSAGWAWSELIDPVLIREGVAS